MPLRRHPENGRKVTVTDYTAPHWYSVMLVNTFANRAQLAQRGESGVIAFGEQAERGGGVFSGDLGPHQRFAGAAGLIGNTEIQSGLFNGLPAAQPPGSRVPTIYDLMRDMDAQTNAGLMSTGAG